ncbi:MAG: hypothetical protein CL765_07760 [Chloroflexi bacterium]|nr:hypothetical protein [Chloroflexota bacterium]|tara:strand:+ start:1423 stop:2082 length:660 start_codon:yes stop_codon:yes gene_type:complete
MNSNKLPGYLLAIGPILMMAMFIAVWPALVGTTEKEGLVGEALVKAVMETSMENFSITKIVATLTGAAMMATMLGYTLWARSLNRDGLKGATLASIAAITIPVATAGLMFSMDFNFAAGDAWQKGDIGNSLIIGAVAEYASFGSTFIWVFVHIAVVFIGLATVLQVTDKISRGVGAILAIIGLIMFVMNFTTLDDSIIGMLWMLITVVSGINLIRQKTS